MPIIIWVASAFVTGIMFAGRAHAESLKTEEHRKQVHEKLAALDEKIKAIATKTA